MKNKTILIIDDDKDIVQTVKGNLKLDGFHVIYAYLGRQGNDMVETQTPDLIL